MISFHLNEPLSYEEFREFLTRSDLGAQYPSENFEVRTRKLLANRTLAITARQVNGGQLVGLCFGMSDLAYFLYITDIGVARDWAQKGIGREMLERMHEAAGGPDEITVILQSNRKALGFYHKNGFETDSNLVRKSCRVWTPHKVT